MLRVDCIDHRVLLKRMFKEIRRKGFSIEKTPYIGPGPHEDEEQLGRCYPRRKIFLVDGMVQEEQDITALHELTHSQGGKSERITEQVAQKLYRDMSPSQLRKLRRYIPPDTSE